jgi:aminoglycoside phosphotransferase (APT) family kinase protein
MHTVRKYSPTGVSNRDRPAAGDGRAIVATLRQMGIVGAHQHVRLTPLEGGVSSAIFRADLPRRVVCVKRALSRLRVAAEWRAPVVRNRYEAEWMRVAGRAVPGAVPKVLGEDPAAGAFAMDWLPPERYPVWKQLLRDGAVGVATAAAVGTMLGRLHAATAERAELAARFATGAIFEAIRIEPYLLATARAHPDLGARLGALAVVTRTTARVLVHGDFSPKNLLIGPNGPVVLDAECAWYGDPAFDVAFVLNHLLLKAVWRPAHARAYHDAFAALVKAYDAHVRWEPRHAVAGRTAALLPALMLARVDGKSPVEYLESADDKDRVRRFAREHLAAPVAHPDALAQRWFGGALG